MNSAVHHLALTDSELELIAELLEREHGELPSEIHHTNSRAFRESLRRRMEVTEALLERLSKVRAA